MSDAGRLVQEFNAITEHFSPRVIAMANGQYFKLAKSRASFRSTRMPTRTNSSWSITASSPCVIAIARWR